MRINLVMLYSNTVYHVETVEMILGLTVFGPMETTIEYKN